MSKPTPLMLYRRFAKTLLAAFAITQLAACGGGGGGTSTPPTTAPPPIGFVATSVDSALDYGVDNGADGVWVYIDDGTSPPVTKAAGIANRTSLASAQTNDLFKIASVSKMFVAITAVKLVDSGQLQLNDTLAFWLPTEAARIANANQITVRQLLQHRSGVPDFDSRPDFSWARPHTDEDALLQTVYDLPADFDPNARYEYSNTNYLLIGRILDTALGYHHHDFVQNTILSPLGMTDSYSLLRNVDLALLARGYWDGVDRTAQDYTIPGGSMVSTATDVGVFIRALATGNLLNANERSVYTSLFTGFGHSGWLPGFQSQARYYSDMDTVVIQFVNTTGGVSEQVASDVHEALLQYLRGQ